MPNSTPKDILANLCNAVEGAPNHVFRFSKYSYPEEFTWIQLPDNRVELRKNGIKLKNGYNGVEFELTYIYDTFGRVLKY